jgi:hypothetical protein
VHSTHDLGDDVVGAGVVDGVDRVEPKAVDVVVADPALGALQHPLADRIAVSAVEVDCVPPGCLIFGSEIRSEPIQRLDPRGADVVVDDVEDHLQAMLVRGGDELGKTGGSAVGGVRCRDVHAVISPAVVPGKLGHRHHLDRGHADLRKLCQMCGRRLERALGRERPDMHLIDHELCRSRRRRPLGRGDVKHARRPAQAPGL